MDNNSTSKKCIVCGFPLRKQANYPSGNVSKDYCKYCGDENDLYSYDRLVEGMSGYISKTEKIDEKTAKQKAVEWIKSCEAFKQGRIKE